MYVLLGGACGGQCAVRAVLAVRAPAVVAELPVSVAPGRAVPEAQLCTAVTGACTRARHTARRGPL